MVTGLPGSGEIVTVLQVAIKRASWEERVEEAEVRTVITISQDPEQVGVAQPAKGESEGRLQCGCGVALDSHREGLYLGQELLPITVSQASLVLWVWQCVGR